MNDKIVELHEKYGDPYETAAFRGNQNLVDRKFKPLIPEELFQEYVREIVKCRRDPVYFCNNYYYIISPSKGKHIISTYPKQEDMINCFIKNTRVVALAARQTGKCVCKDTMITVRNKSTGEVEEISMEDFKNKLMEENNV